MLPTKQRNWAGIRWVMAIIVILFASSAVIAMPTLAQSGSGTTPDEIFADVYQRVSPSVVSINVVTEHPVTDSFEFDQEIVGGGTGFVVDMDGHIVTNNHVVDGASEIEINFIDGTLASADIVGVDPDSDLAVLQVNLPEEDLAELKPVEFGDSSQIFIGQTVLAIGSPFGQRWTLTSGIVSATDRNISSLSDFSIGGVIQTDAAINPGNSGGPLLDLDGRVIGVNSQIISQTRSNSGISFAIPGNLTQRVVQDLMDKGFVEYSYLGITGRDVFLPQIEAFDLPNDTQGVVVIRVIDDGPASNGGLMAAVFSEDENENDPRAVPESMDIITAINGQELSGINELIGYLAEKTQPGDEVTLSVLRVNSDTVEDLSLDVVLSPRP